MNNQPEVYEYPKCPVCGSEETLIASLATEEMNKGVNPGSIPRFLHTWPFVMRNPRQPVIIGSRTVAGNVSVDICKGCGIIRAIRIEIGEAMVLERPPRG